MLNKKWGVFLMGAVFCLGGFIGLSCFYDNNFLANQKDSQIPAEDLPAIEVSQNFLFGTFSQPRFYIVKNGSSNISNFSDPVNGTDITNATVIVRNVTTGVSKEAKYNAPSGTLKHGFYTISDDLEHEEGQEVAFVATIEGKTIAGKPTATPFQAYSDLSPASSSTVTRPFKISWKVINGDNDAKYSRVIIWDLKDTTNIRRYQAFVPMATTTVEITSKEIDYENITIQVMGVNSMEVTNAASGSTVYVGNNLGGTFSSNITVK